ncbi:MULTISPECIES: hypothetical protein [unclassified Curtobacterium]|uniref:hypothetical protein n=1 Tax=unclassified Curtobacterium TaxID=257496 RepID=UPI0008270871|nr:MULTISPECIES: hypothetical protein [unclassified Curtobacterium]WIB00344.1 hypothetical protein QOL15_01245 [Curtobacterium sp. MCBA15_012]
MNEPDASSDWRNRAAAFRQILNRETARVAVARLSEVSWFGHRTWEDLSRQEQDDILGWVELVSAAQIEAYGSALKLAGLEVDDA